MSDINYNNITSLDLEDAAAGQRVVKITRNGTSVYYPIGIAKKGTNKYTPLLDHVYYHDVYDSVAYLDADNSINSVGWSGNAPATVELWIASIDGTSSGNIVLQYGENQTVVPVTGSIEKFIWNINQPLQGEISIVRLTDSDLDTLKDSDGNCMTAIVADWQVA